MAVSAAGPVLLAHQGGWDEILLIAGPIVLIMALLWLAKRRVDHAASVQASSAANAGTHGAGSGAISTKDPGGRPDAD